MPPVVCGKCGGTGPTCPAQGAKLRRELLTPADQAMWNINLSMVLWECRPWYQRLWLWLRGKRPY